MLRNCGNQNSQATGWEPPFAEKRATAGTTFARVCLAKENLRNMNQAIVINVFALQGARQ